MLRLLLYILFDEKGGTLSITRKTANTLATASAMNTNYDEIEAVVNGGIDADNIENDGVTAAKLNSDVVRAGYGLIQHTDGTLYVDVSDTTPCLELTDGGLRVKVDGTTITRGASGLVAAIVSDHGALSGLGDDDHVAIYLNTTRHDVVARHPISVGGTGQITAGAAFAALAAGKLYDSGWFEVTRSTTYTKTHNLGTTKVLTMCYLAQNSDGSGWCVPGIGQMKYSDIAEQFQSTICALSTTQIKIRTAGNGLCRAMDENGNDISVNAGTAYYRIIMIALE